MTFAVRVCFYCCCGHGKTYLLHQDIAALTLAPWSCVCFKSKSELMGCRFRESLFHLRFKRTNAVVLWLNVWALWVYLVEVSGWIFVAASNRLNLIALHFPVSEQKSCWRFQKYRLLSRTFWSKTQKKWIQCENFDPLLGLAFIRMHTDLGCWILSGVLKLLRPAFLLTWWDNCVCSSCTLMECFINANSNHPLISLLTALLRVLGRVFLLSA